MKEAFQTAYDELNTQQQAAVNYLDGPLLVIAGPGTGKTQILSLRVANILRQTDTLPGSILCLTFTNFAATNMRQRLQQIIGSASQKVVVRTFHSFAAEIMNLYPDYFWNGAQLSVVPGAVQIEIIQSILLSLPLNNPLALRFAGKLTALNDVQKALKLIKEAGLTPDKLKAMISFNLAYLDTIEEQLIKLLSPALSLKKLPALLESIKKLSPQSVDATLVPLLSLNTILIESLSLAITADQLTTKTSHTGRWKRRWIQSESGQRGMFDERRRNAWWMAMVEVYNLYRNNLHDRGYYDYSDMIIEVISQLEFHPDLLRSVQERYLYVLIDEFQDTNAAQLRLAHNVAGSSSNEGKPNLMAVGDDDQSIFAFNGAELNNMLSFQRAYPTTRIIILQKNYRSSQAILDYASTIIENAEDRLVKRQPNLIKHLIATKKTLPGIIKRLTYATRDHQYAAIANRVLELWRNDSSQTIAVLARRHESLIGLSAILHDLNVPIRYEQQNNILEISLIQQIYLVSEVVNAIAEGNQTIVNNSLSVLLRHPAWHITPHKLWNLALMNQSSAAWLDSLLNDNDPSLASLGQWFLWLVQKAAFEPLPVVLEYLIGLRTGEYLTSPLREYFLSHQDLSSDYLRTLSGLRILRDLVNEFSAVNDQVRLGDFLRYIKLNQQLGQKITDESWFISGQNAVQLMSVHKAKGLEFDNVFLLDATEVDWQPRRSGRKPPANLPLQPYGEHYDDYIRLAYVAISRAKRSFVVSDYLEDDKGQIILSSPIFNNLPTQIISASSSSKQKIKVLEQAISWPRLDSRDEQILLAPRLENYYLSSTALLQFLDISTGGPKKFLERQLLHLPQPTSPVMAYGTAIHQALQTAQILTRQNKFNLQTVLKSYDSSLSQQILSQSETERYLEHGQKILSHLLSQEMLTIHPDGQAEIAIYDVIVGEAKLNGKIDNLLFTPPTLLITDYKTGKPLTSFTTHDQTKAIKAWRHRTQLLFYAILVQASQRFSPLTSITTQMIYVEAEDQRSLNLSLVPTIDELDRLKRLICIVWSHIQNLNFPETDCYSPDRKGIDNFENDLLDGKI